MCKSCPVVLTNELVPVCDSGLRVWLWDTAYRL